MKRISAFFALFALILFALFVFYLVRSQTSVLDLEQLTNLLVHSLSDEWVPVLTFIAAALFLNLLIFSALGIFSRQPISEEELEQLEEQLNTLKSSLNEFTEKNSTLECEKNDIQATCLKMQNQNKTFEERIAHLESDLSSETDLRKELFSSKEKNKNLETEKVSLHKDLKKQQSENVELKEKVSEKESALHESQKKAESLSKELEAMVANQKGGKGAVPPAVYQIFYLLQKEGRFVDLMMEDISAFDDETLGAAVRPLHEGCSKILKDRIIIEPVLNEEEGTQITLNDFDAEQVKITGNLPPSAPYTGELVHAGWKIKSCNLPEIVDGWANNIIAQAEIEI